MTNEIKEILEALKSHSDIVKEYPLTLSIEEQKILLDYITNLKDKLNRIDKLINTDYGWVSYYYKYNNKYLKSEIKEDINNILRGDE